MRPKITYRNIDIAYKSDSQLVGIHITENSKFESLVRYCIVFCGADNENMPIFRLQKKVIRSVCGDGTGTSCRQLFKDCKILSVTSMYVLKCYVL